MISKITNMFSFDLRLLGISRILLGLILFLDILTRSFDLSIFYTDDGVYSRALLLKNDWFSWNWSVNMITGVWEGQVFIFGFTMLCALMVLIGYKTKVFLVLSYLLLISIQTRNPLIHYGGDLILKLLIFYSIFLPVHARYAVDKVKKTTLPTSGKVLSLATIAYILQVVSIYVFAGIAKDGENWLDGSAVYYALSMDKYATALVAYIMEFPRVLTFLSHSTLYLETFGCLLLFVPFFWKYFRTVGVLMFMSLHFGFFLFMTLGIFPWVAIIMWIVMFPPMIADIIEKYTQKWGIYQRLAFYRDKIRNWLSTWKPSLRFTTSSYKKLGWLPSGLLGIVALSIFLGNLSGTKLDFNNPPFFQKVIRLTATWQSWTMFAPGPPKGDGWFVMDAQIRNGQHIDILNERDTVDFSKPELVSATYKNARWQRYLTTMMYNAKENYRNEWGKYYCRCWNEEHENTPRELESFKIYFMKEWTPPMGEQMPTPEKIDVWSHWCKDKFQNRFATQQN